MRIVPVLVQLKRWIIYNRHAVLINNLVVWGVSVGFAMIALASGQIGYVTSHYCGPSLASGPALVWIPLLFYIAIVLVLVTWMLIEICRVRNPPFTFDFCI
jgi:hypothetical protein